MMAIVYDLAEAVSPAGAKGHELEDSGDRSRPGTCGGSTVGLRGKSPREDLIAVGNVIELAFETATGPSYWLAAKLIEEFHEERGEPPPAANPPFCPLRRLGHPEERGFEAVRQIARDLAVRVILLQVNGEVAYTNEAVRCGGARKLVSRFCLAEGVRAAAVSAAHPADLDGARSAAKMFVPLRTAESDLLTVHLRTLWTGDSTPTSVQKAPLVLMIVEETGKRHAQMAVAR